MQEDVIKQLSRGMKRVLTPCQQPPPNKAREFRTNKCTSLTVAYTNRICSWGEVLTLFGGSRSL